MRDVPTNSAWAASITRAAERDEQRRAKTMTTTVKEWSGSCDPCDPDNYWIDDDTGERVSAITNERTEHDCPLLDAAGRLIEEE